MLVQNREPSTCEQFYGSGVRQFEERLRQLGCRGVSEPMKRTHSSFVRLRPARRQRATISFSSSTSQSLIWPSAPPLASRLSASTTRDQTGLPCRRSAGSPTPSLGQSL